MRTPLALLLIGLMTSLSAGAVQTLSFDDFKGACSNPAQFHNQIAPTNIEISCRDVQTRWIPDSNKTFPLAITQDVTVSLISDKYRVDAASSAVPLVAIDMACPEFKQVIESVETVRAVTCSDILAYPGTPTQFCLEALDSLKLANPAAVVRADSGQRLSLCGKQTRP